MLQEGTRVIFVHIFELFSYKVTSSAPHISCRWVKLLADRNEVFFSAAPQARRLAVTSWDARRSAATSLLWRTATLRSTLAARKKAACHVWSGCLQERCWRDVEAAVGAVALSVSAWRNCHWEEMECLQWPCACAATLSNTVRWGVTSHSVARSTLLILTLFTYPLYSDLWTQ
jgi:hypothetical protein